MKIRPSRSDDAPALAALWHEMARFHARQGAYWRIKPNSKKGYLLFMQEVVKAEDKVVFVAEVEDRPVGFILAQVSKRARIFVQSAHGHIVDLAVTKDYRRHGVGARLVRRAIRWFKTKGLSSVEMRVSTANPVATAFWRKMGFEPYMTMNKREI